MSRGFTWLTFPLTETNCSPGTGHARICLWFILPVWIQCSCDQLSFTGNLSTETQVSLCHWCDDVFVWVSLCPLQFMQQFYNSTYLERYGRPMEENFLTLLWSLSVSMYPLGGFFGSLMVAPLVNKLGRYDGIQHLITSVDHNKTLTHTLHIQRLQFSLQRPQFDSPHGLLLHVAPLSLSPHFLSLSPTVLSMKLRPNLFLVLSV